ncbi:MAG: DUF6629 family protein [Parvularculaceae bacterium]
MCFSATASFTAAGALAVVGAATLAQRPAPRLLPFALTPTIFAVHQAIEGVIWLDVAAGKTPTPALVAAWVFIAKTFWPAWTPFMVFMMERSAHRRLGLVALLITGLTTAGVLLYVQIISPYTVEVASHHLNYLTAHPLSEALIGLYVLSTVAPLLISRARLVELFGVVVLAGSIATEMFFTLAGASVWCFFAAIASIAVYFAVRAQTRAQALS